MINVEIIHTVHMYVCICIYVNMYYMSVYTCTTCMYVCLVCVLHVPGSGYILNNNKCTLTYTLGSGIMYVC